MVHTLQNPEIAVGGAEVAGAERGARGQASKITDEQAGLVVTRTLNERGPGRTRTDRPRPFIWTKTADEILETLAAYCQRINDPGH